MLQKQIKIQAYLGIMKVVPPYIDILVILIYGNVVMKGHFFKRIDIIRALNTGYSKGF